MREALRAQPSPSRPAGFRRGEDPSMLLYEGLPQLVGTPDILASLSAAEVIRVIEAGQLVRFGVGDTLFQQGEPHTGIFIVRRGIVRSFYLGPSGREITLANWAVNNFVGGPEIFGGGTHVWSGVGVQAGEAVRLPGDTVRVLMTEIPAFAVGLVEGLAFKGKCYSALLQMLGTRAVVERLAHLLLNLAEMRGVKSEEKVVISRMPTHEQLAGMIGATRQWISIALGRFRDQGLIEIRERRVVIRGEEGLRRIAEGT